MKPDIKQYNDDIKAGVEMGVPKVREEYRDLPPCIDMVIYRKLEKILSHLAHKDIGITDGIDAISNLLTQRTAEIEKEIEGMRPDTCNCTGAKYECEHWGKHEIIDEILVAIRKFNK